MVDIHGVPILNIWVRHTLVYCACASLCFMATGGCANPTSEQHTASKRSPIQTVEPQKKTVWDTLPIDRSTSYLMGKFDPATRSEFSKVDTAHADRPNLHLRKDTYRAFSKMHEAAKKEGIKLIIRSATRNFDSQKNIWERKWNGITKLEGNIDATTISNEVERALAILRYSSMPGTSRHHWGTDIDLNAFHNAYFEKGEGLQIYQWLKKHAHDFGFCQPYTEKGVKRPAGYQEEKWHWSYLPVATVLLEAGEASLNNSDIVGFKGFKAATSIGVVENYVLGIDPICKNKYK